MTDVELPCRNTVNKSLLLLLLLLLLKNNRTDFLNNVWKNENYFKDVFPSVYFFLSYIARKKVKVNRNHSVLGWRPILNQNNRFKTVFESAKIILSRKSSIPFHSPNELGGGATSL